MSKSPEHLGSIFMSGKRKYEVQRQGNFEVQITDVGGGTDLILAVSSAPLPTESNEVVELPYGNTTVKVAGKMSVDDIDLEVRDFIDPDIMKLLKDWRRKVYDPDSDTVGTSDKYKKTGYIYQYAPDGSMVRTWRIDGVWPSSFNPGDLSQDSLDAKMMTLTLSVDKAYLDY